MADEQKQSDVTYFQDLRFYKPNNKGTGAASALQYKIKQGQYAPEPQLFWVMAPQVGKDDNDNAKFAWKSKEQEVTIKLGLPDLGEILAVLTGLKQAAGAQGKGLYHQSKNGNATMEFKEVHLGEGQERTFAGYGVRIATKKNGGELVQVKHMLTPAEGLILKLALETVARAYINWSF